MTDRLEAPLGPVALTPKSGTERFLNAGETDPFTVLEFWQWSASDLMENTARGVLAEFIIAKALGISTRGVCDSWGASDLKTDSGQRIQVKASGYLQSWAQTKLSSVSFSVLPKRAWDRDTNLLDQDPARHADVYVFALLAHRDKATVDPLDLSQWRFFVVSANEIANRTRSQHSITLPSLERLAGPGVAFADLREAFARVVAESTTTAPSRDGPL